MRVYIYNKKAENGQPLSKEILNVTSIIDNETSIAVLYNEDNVLRFYEVGKNTVSRINVAAE